MPFCGGGLTKQLSSACISLSIKKPYDKLMKNQFGLFRHDLYSIFDHVKYYYHDQQIIF